jgi:hypothetical protein
VPLALFVSAQAASIPATANATVSRVFIIWASLRFLAKRVPRASYPPEGHKAQQRLALCWLVATRVA